MELLVDGVYQLGTRAVNSYIIDGDEGVTLVDTLTAKGGRQQSPTEQLVRGRVGAVWFYCL